MLRHKGRGMRYFKTYVSGILGGLCIALGGVAFLSLENNILGALFFTVGLFTICTLGLNLFTGKVCYVFQRDRVYAMNLPFIWLGNLTGTVIVGLLVQATRMSANLVEWVQGVCQAKLSDGWLSLFLLGVLCNIFIYIAVEGFNQNPHQIGKYLSLFFGVMVFILCGYEHCVADMFYFTVAGVWSVDTFLRLLVITLGNAVGGVLFPLVRTWLAKPD